MLCLDVPAQLCLVTGYSGSEQLTHDALDTDVLVREIGLRVLLPTERSKFPILVAGREEGMKLWKGYGKPFGLYFGPTGKNAGKYQEIVFNIDSTDVCMR